MIEYACFTQADRQDVLRVLTEEMTAAEAAAKAAAFDWQYAGNPHNTDVPPFVVARENGNVIAVNGMMPVRSIHQGIPRPAVWTCDAHVTIPFRRRGICTDIKKLQRELAPVMVAYGISDITDIVLDRLGWELHPDVAGYFFYAAEPGIKGFLKNLRSRFHRRSNASAIAVTAESKVDCGPEVDDLWVRSLPTYFSTFERDAAYLNWKYRDNPVISYCSYAARRDGQLLGLLVARADRNTSVIVDYCGPRGNDELLGVLVDAAVSDLCERGTARIQCETSDPGVARALRGSGFRRSVGTYRFRVRCNLTQTSRPTDDFFLMGGDGDNDFSAAIAQQAGAGDIFS